MPRLDAPMVLIVDDDDGIRATFERILARAGFVPLVCADPRQALQRCIAERPAVVVSDYSMPHMTGVELAEQIVAALGVDAPPVIIATGHALEDLPISRASLSLAKPVTPSDLVEAVELFLPDKRV